MRISALHPHMPFRASRGCHRYPLIFTGAGRASGSSFPQEAGGVRKMRPDFATSARRRPASGSCCRGQAERALMRDTIRRLSQWMPRCVCRARLRTPILPWAFAGFFRACRMPFQRHVRMPMLVVEHRYTANRRSRTFRWAAIRSWVLWRTVAGRALGLQAFEYRATEATSLPSPALQRVRAICA